jgi:hypothetical protein
MSLPKAPPNFLFCFSLSLVNFVSEKKKKKKQEKRKKKKEH